jgi:hypothetical protein
MPDHTGDARNDILVAVRAWLTEAKKNADKNRPNNGAGLLNKTEIVYTSCSRAWDHHKDIPCTAKEPANQLRERKGTRRAEREAKIPKSQAADPANSTP